jgi:uncharacterized membrane protein
MFGALLATAVALAFTSSAKAEPSPSVQPQQVKCLGANACKGQSACATAASSCKGMNMCKGKGYIVTSDEKACVAKGGHVGKKAPMKM